MTPRPSDYRLVYWLFATAIFVSAALLFCVQPMVGKMILPLLGGTPAVWNTCMVFFQAVLLAGYLYAHASSRRLGVRRQAVLHLGLLAAPLPALALLTLPLQLTRDPSAAAAARFLAWVGPPPTGEFPAPWLLCLLAVTLGLPFFIVSTTAPLLQKWFAATGHPAATDPYFLYAASNLGSMLALVSYPFLLEPGLPLERQAHFWAAGYLVLVALLLACAVVLGRSPAGVPVTDPQQEMQKGPAPGRGRILRWVVLAFVPSSLMLGLTTFITTDIASIPLLWVVPLAIYLLTFILAFSRRSLVPLASLRRLLPLVVLVVILTYLGGPLRGMWQMIPLHLLGFFIVALYCHQSLAEDRPPAEYLTSFFLWLSVGGVLGGLFNGLAAPMLFRKVGVVEYPLVLIFSCGLRPGKTGAGSVLDRWLGIGGPLAIGGAAAVLFGGFPALGWSFTVLMAVLALAILGGACCLLIQRPIAFALSLGLLTAAAAGFSGSEGVRFSQRNFYGLIRVRDVPGLGFRQLIHGNTVHGIQSLDPSRSRQPLAYYFHTGPIAQLLQEYQKKPVSNRVAVVGLGIGVLANFAKPGQDWTFYEIDPAVEMVARGYFTFLDQSPAGGVTVILGDGRLKLREIPDHSFGLIVLDAFSSDAVPMHLLTAEALAIYTAKLAPHGLLVFNVSNHYVNLKPVLADLAAAAELVCFGRDDLNLAPEEVAQGKFPSQWVVLAAAEADIGSLVRDERWRRLHCRPGVPVWTDDFSNLIGAFKWK